MHTIVRRNAHHQPKKLGEGFDMDGIMLVLRLIHIVAGAFWVGAAIMVAGYIEPTVRATAPNSQKFMQRLLAGNFPATVATAALLTILAGLLLYWRDSGGFQINWITTSQGLILTLGALAAIGAGTEGFAVINPTTRRLGALGAEITASGAPPTAGQMAEVSSLQDRLRRTGRRDAVLLVVAVAAMAIWRYV
ncbi:MAG: hypothetical protein HYR71_06900 [Chloroflexi bacterium]|nr:hypothetical protein [Chloroflexota bacterium]